ncbi:CRP/FNR family transcriptional activator FtrB [Phenylobacterium koreense]|uniref:CRP/FNR family transcriptional activator FtrB n=1 Tax=Phenylobacterium koreense TaxID=266125 RepID=A0ABV2ELL6_9CAUL
MRRLPLFAPVDEETFRRLTATAFLQKFPAGADLLTEGDPVDFLYILLDGSIELSGTWNDKETTLAVLGPVSTFILAAVILDAPATMNARTIGWSDILMIPGAALRAAIEEDVRFSSAVALELSGCYQGLVRAIKNQKLRGGLERLANYLLAQQSRQGGGPTLTLPYEKRFVASLLGMSPENLSRAFSSLQDYGVIVDGPQVTITRPAVLERLAKPDPLIDKHLPTDAILISKADRERNLQLGAHRAAPLSGTV